jgi:hypothetical protein
VWEAVHDTSGIAVAGANNVEYCDDGLIDGDNEVKFVSEVGLGANSGDCMRGCACQWHHSWDWIENLEESPRRLEILQVHKAWSSEMSTVFSK